MDATHIPANLISSQRFLDDEIVEAKRAAEDYTVAVAQVVVDGVEYQVVVDGHHSMAAAKADGVAVDFEACHPESQAHANRDPLGFLEQNHAGDDYYFVATGHLVW